MSFDGLVSEIEQRCAKFQFEDAELLADLLCSQETAAELGSYIYGRVLVQQFKYGPAIQYLSRCRLPKSYYFLALSYLATSEWEKSLDAIARLTSCRDDSSEYPDFMGFELGEADVLQLKGRIFETMGDAQAAVDCFASAVERDELSVYSHYRRHKLGPLVGLGKDPCVGVGDRRRQKRKRSSHSASGPTRERELSGCFKSELGAAVAGWGITRLDSLFLKTVSASELYEQGNFVEVLWLPSALANA